MRAGGLTSPKALVHMWREAIMADETEEQAPDQTPDAPPEAPVEEVPPVTAPARASGTPLDETVPGGAYVVGGQLVDAEGKPVKAKKR